jgi:hypothetical protein
MSANVANAGFEIVPGVLSAVEVGGLLRELGPVEGAGRRGLLGVPAVRELAKSSRLMSLVKPYVGPSATPVRGIYFDKSAEANWTVGWHQDVTIAVRERREVAGFGPWSVKDGVPHVTAPAEYLERMLAVRLHLDDADEENGALRVLAGSHRFGRLSDERIDELVQELPEIVCCARAGDALLMRPLLLHASSRSTSARRRRVLHIEYAGFELPGGLEWCKGKGAKAPYE